jgi:hypothetical protein
MDIHHPASTSDHKLEPRIMAALITHDRGHRLR